MPPTSTDSTNNSTPSPNTSANSLDQFPHHSQESIRNLIAANFKQPKPQPQQQPHPQQQQQHMLAGGIPVAYPTQIPLIRH